MDPFETRGLTRLRMSDAVLLFRLTARAIRFYEERGLITAERDPRGHRFYAPAARRSLAWIAALRPYKISLSDIQTVLNAGEDDAARAPIALAMLARRKDRLQTELKALEEVMQRLQLKAARPRRASKFVS